MKYKNIVEGTFIARPNRFIAYVSIDGIQETVHVKNTGRCKEILIPGTKVILEKSDNPDRKTKYDLVTAYVDKVGWINIDSQAPNKIAYEWLQNKRYDYIKPECTYGKSRIDFYMEKGNEKYFMEVKGCTLQRDGIGYFPDAPTERGVKHLEELMKAAQEGYRAMLAFVIQINIITEVRPNIDTHKEFAEAFYKAKESGVEIIFICCDVDKEQVKAIN